MILLQKMLILKSKRHHHQKQKVLIIKRSMIFINLQKQKQPKKQLKLRVEPGHVLELNGLSMMRMKKLPITMCGG